MLTAERIVGAVEAASLGIPKAPVQAAAYWFAAVYLNMKPRQIASFFDVSLEAARRSLQYSKRRAHVKTLARAAFELEQERGRAT